MNLVEKLLAAGKDVEKETKILRSKRLGKIIGEEFAEIKVQELSGRTIERIKQISSTGKDNGYESNLLCCMYGIVEPDIKNEDLCKRFGVSTPKDLCEKLFDAEVYSIADEIINISGISAGEEEVKN